MKEFTNVAGRVTSFAGNVNLLFSVGYHAQGHDLNVFGTFCDTSNPEIVVSFKERANFFKVCLVLIFLNTIVEKTYPEP